MLNEVPARVLFSHLSHRQTPFTPLKRRPSWSMSQRRIAVYCRYGLVTPIANQRGYYFDGRSIKTLRAIEGLRSVCGDDLAGIKMILRLMNEVQRLNSEVHSLNLETTRSNNRKVKKYERRT